MADSSIYYTGFGYVVLYIFAYIGGKLVEMLTLGLKITKKFKLGPYIPNVPIPLLLGMLLFGFICRNLPWQMLEHMDSKVNSYLLDVALFLLIYKAGISLDLDVLRQKPFTILALALLPQLGEMLIAYSFGRVVWKMPNYVALTQGYMLVSASIAVAAPIVLELIKKGYGADKGIPSICIVSITIDVIVSTLLFGIFLGMALDEPSKLMGKSSGTPGLIGTAFIELVAALIIGIFNAFILIKFGKKWPRFWQMVIVTSLDAFFYFTPKYTLNFKAFTLLQMVTLNAVLAKYWPKASIKECITYMNLGFGIIQYMLFGIVGASISVKILFSNKGLMALELILSATPARFVLVFLVLMFSGFLAKERIFFSFLWVAKSTLQAVNSVQFYYHALAKPIPDPQQIDYGIDIMTTGILAIAICAPIGGLVGLYTGKRYLNQMVDNSEFITQQTEAKPIKEKVDKEESNGHQAPGQIEMKDLKNITEDKNEGGEEDEDEEEVKNSQVSVLFEAEEGADLRVVNASSPINRRFTDFEKERKTSIEPPRKTSVQTPTRLPVVSKSRKHSIEQDRNIGRLHELRDGNLPGTIQIKKPSVEYAHVQHHEGLQTLRKDSHVEKPRRDTGCAIRKVSLLAFGGGGIDLDEIENMGELFGVAEDEDNDPNE